MSLTDSEILTYAAEFDAAGDRIAAKGVAQAEPAADWLHAEAEAWRAAIGAPAGEHDYYDSLTARGDCLLHYSLRDPAQLASVVQLGKDEAPRVTYDPTMDAAKIVIDPDANSLKTQARWRIPDTRNVPVIFTWDCYWTAAFLYAVHEIANYKTWQLATRFDGGGLSLEINNDFAGGRSQSAVARTKVRLYGKNAMGPNVVDEQPLLPQANEFYIMPDRWTRYWVRLVPWTHPDTGEPWWQFSLWLADEEADPVQVFADLVIRPVGNDGLPLPYWVAFWLEFNTSDNTPILGRPPLVAYARNWAAVQTDSLPMERPRRAA